MFVVSGAGVSEVSFTTSAASLSSPLVCALTTGVPVTSLGDQWRHRMTSDVAATPLACALTTGVPVTSPSDQWRHWVTRRWRTVQAGARSTSRASASTVRTAFRQPVTCSKDCRQRLPSTQRVHITRYCLVVRSKYDLYHPTPKKLQQSISLL